MFVCYIFFFFFSGDFEEPPQRAVVIKPDIGSFICCVSSHLITSNLQTGDISAVATINTSIICQSSKRKNDKMLFHCQLQKKLSPNTTRMHTHDHPQYEKTP